MEKSSAKSFRQELKKSGVFHTKPELANIVRDKLLKLAGKDEVFEVVDLCCGTGNLLTPLKDIGVPFYDTNLYGYDINEGFVETAKEAGVNAFQCNSLRENPLNKKFSFMVGNYPFGIKGDGYTEEQWKELKGQEYYKDLPPLSNILDTHFLLRVIELLEDNGRAVIIGGTGVGYRANKEEQFRQWLIEKKILKSIHYLSGKFFDDTNISIMVLEIIKDGAQEAVTFITSEGESKEVSLDEIKENKCNLSVHRYIKPKDDREEIDIDKLENELMINEVGNLRRAYDVCLLVDDSLKHCGGGRFEKMFEAVEELQKTYRLHYQFLKDREKTKKKEEKMRSLFENF